MYYILNEKYDVDMYVAHTKKHTDTCFTSLISFLHHFRKMEKYKLIYIWFGRLSLLIPVLFGKIFKIKSVRSRRLATQPTFPKLTAALLIRVLKKNPEALCLSTVCGMDWDL